MVHPLGVNLFEQNNALQFAGDVFAQFFFAFCVHLVYLLFHLLCQSFFIQILEVFFLYLKQIPRNNTDKVVAEAFQIPVFRLHALRHIHRDCRINGFVHHRKDRIFQIFSVQNFVALRVDNLTLLVHNIVKLQYIFTNTKVSALNLALCIFNGIGQNFIFNRHILVNFQRIHHRVDAVAAKQSHQIVFQGEVESRTARVALTSGTSAQLVVDTSGFMTLGTDDE